LPAPKTWPSDAGVSAVSTTGRAAEAFITSPSAENPEMKTFFLRLTSMLFSPAFTSWSIPSMRPMVILPIFSSPPYVVELISVMKSLPTSIGSATSSSDTSGMSTISLGGPESLKTVYLTVPLVSISTRSPSPTT
jgi:hypothetical protein